MAEAEANVMSKPADGTVQVIQQSRHQHKQTQPRNGEKCTDITRSDRDVLTYIPRENVLQVWFKTAYCLGLASGLICFQRLMSTILKGLARVQCYLEDIVSVKTFEEHDKNLNATLQRLEAAGLKLNFDKCHIRQTELSFLGHII